MIFRAGNFCVVNRPTILKPGTPNARRGPMAVSFRSRAAFFVPLGAVLALLLIAVGPTIQPPLTALPAFSEVPLSSSSILDQAGASLATGKGPAHGESVLCVASDQGDSQCMAPAAPPKDPSVSQPYWTNLTPPVSPPALEFASMTYDAADGYVLLFGGLSESAYPTNDTWTFHDGGWQNITATAGVAPAARSGMAMTYDAADHYVLAFGGYALGACSSTSPGSTCNDTWSFVSGKWSRVPTYFPLTVLEEPAAPQLTFDAADSYVVMLAGGFTWKYVAGVWTQFCPAGNCSRPLPGPGQLSGATVYDDRDGYVLFCAEGQTWTFSGGVWTNITASSPPSPPFRIDPQLAYDDVTGQVILFGGYGPGGVPRNDTWAFSNGTWTNVTSGSSPPSRYGGAMTNDSADSSMLLFGGDTQGGSAGNLNDTWVWGTSPPIAGLVIGVRPAVPLPGSGASFTSASRGGVGPFAYSWNFGDGGSSSTPNPTHDFAAEGLYEVQLWLNDSAGHTAYASTLVRVYVPLTITALRANPNPALLDRVVNLSANATGGTPPYTYSWAFGDGGTGGDLSNITHIYTTNGPFVVEVTVTDSAGGEVHSYLNVSIQLQALAGSTATSGFSPLTVTFVGQAEGGVPPYGFTWNFGDGTTASTVQNPTHQFNATGTFTVELNVVDAQGNRSTSSLTVTVGGPSAPGSLSSDWLIAFVLAAGIAGVVAVAWGLDRAHQRSRRAEGRQWIEELTAPPEHDDGSRLR